MSNREVAHLIYEFDHILYFLRLVTYEIYVCESLESALYDIAFYGLKRHERPDHIGGGPY